MSHQEDGASEILGFILVFAIALSGIALVAAEGYPQLMESRMAACEAAMEQGMFGLQQDVRLLTGSAVPYRDVIIGIPDGTVALISPSDGAAFTISSVLPASGLPVTIRPGAICSRLGQSETVLLFENGAVIRGTEGDNESVMLSPPSWFYDTHSKTLVLSFTLLLPGTTVVERTGRGTATFSSFSEPALSETTFPDPGTTILLHYSPGAFCDPASAWDYYCAHQLPGAVLLKENGCIEAENVCRLVVKINRVTVMQL